MASDKAYLDYISEQLSALDSISCKAMMGEYILFFRGKIIGGIYDNRLLIKPVQSARRMMPEAVYELPYEGAKEMILVEEVDDKAFLTALITAMYDDLPEPKSKAKKKTAKVQ